MLDPDPGHLGGDFLSVEVDPALGQLGEFQIPTCCQLEQGHCRDSRLFPAGRLNEIGHDPVALPGKPQLGWGFRRDRRLGLGT